jgi:prolyl-tRNA editing enzyme YbaK/EbsC (Cys-tRNA(Pro) deacylase)
VKEDQVCKTILLRDGKGSLYAVLTLGYRRVNLDRIEQLTGKEVRLLSLNELKERGLKPGTVCPLTVKAHLIVDEEVFLKERVNFSSGDEYYGVEIRPQDLYKLVEFVRASVSK